MCNENGGGGGGGSTIGGIAASAEQFPPTLRMRHVDFQSYDHLDGYMAVNVNLSKSTDHVLFWRHSLGPLLWYKGWVFTYRYEIEKSFLPIFIVLVPRFPLPGRKFVSCKAAVISRAAYSDINSLQNSCLRVRPGHTVKRQDALSPTVLAESSVCFHVPWFHGNIILLQTPGASRAPRRFGAGSSAPRESIGDPRGTFE